MPKKLLGLIGLFILAAGLLVSLNLAGKKQDIRKKAAANGSILSIDPSSLSVNKDDTFSVAIFINTQGDTVSASELHLTYDQTKLEGQSITAGTFLPEVLSKDLQGNPGGQIGGGNASIILGSGINAKKGSGILSTLTFKALNPSTSQIDFTADTQVVAIDQNGNTLAQATGGTVTVLDVSLTPTVTPDPNATATPIPSVTTIPSATPVITNPPNSTPTPTSILHPSVTPTSASCIRKVHGDADCDGKVDGVDYSFWLNSQCHLSSGQICGNKDADYNHDGNTDDDDYSIWYQFRDI